jgi:hypothetical protein
MFIRYSLMNFIMLFGYCLKLASKFSRALGGELQHLCIAYEIFTVIFVIFSFSNLLLVTFKRAEKQMGGGTVLGRVVRVAAVVLAVVVTPDSKYQLKTFPHMY